MAYLIISMIFTMEILFLLLNIKKLDIVKLRLIARFMYLLIFGSLFLLALADYSMKWLGILILLSILVIISFFQAKKSDSDRVLKRDIIKAIVWLLIFVIALTPALIFPDYELVSVTGDYKVLNTVYTYTDTTRLETYADGNVYRKLNVEYYYPDNYDNKYPLVVFSHGGMGTRTSNTSLYYELASNGYVVCSIDHTYQCLYTKIDGKNIYLDKEYMQELMKENAKEDKQGSYEYYSKWMNIRMGDINYVIDYALSQANENLSDKVYGLIDGENIGVMGHSLGGSAALGIGRVREDISAVIALESPLMYDIIGVEDNEFIFTDEAYPVPTLNVYSDDTWYSLSQLSQYEANDRLLSDMDSDSYYVHIQGSGHFSLTDLSLNSPFLTRLFNISKTTVDTQYCLKTINIVCLEFLDSYLKNKGEFESDGDY